MQSTTTPSATAQTSRHASGMTWRVPYWAWAPLGLAIVAEAAVNSLRAYTLGQEHANATIDVTIFGHAITISVFGAVLVLAAIAMSLSQARAAWVAFKPGALARQRGIAAPIAILLLVVSVTALSLTLLEAQRSKTGDEGGQRTAYDIAKGEYTRAANELEALGTPRPVSVIQADVRSHPIDMRIWRRSNECEDISLQATRTACEPILALYKERGAAARKSELEQALPGLKAKLDALPRPAEPSWVEETVSSSWAWAFGLAAVLIATFGAPLFAEPVPNAPGSNRSPFQGEQPEPSADAPLFANHPALLKNAAPNGSANGSDREGGAVVVALPNVPKRPGPSNGSAATANCPDAQRKADVLTFIRTEAKIGNPIESQAFLGEALGVPKSTLSEMLGELEAEGLIERRMDGRCKVIIPTERALVAAE